ncbi:MAG: zf-HC2 domain-containing protein [Blastocatellia bacterium]
MNCQDCLAQLDDFVYGELGAAESRVVSGHLAGCAACAEARAALEAETALFAQYARQTAPELNPEIWRAVAARLQTDSAGEGAPQTAAVAGRVLVWNNLRQWLGFAFTPAFARQAAFAAALVVVSVSATAWWFSGRQEQGQQARTDVKPVPATPDTRQTPEPTPAASPIKEEAPGKELVVAANAGRGGRHNTRIHAPEPASVSMENDLIEQQIVRAAREYEKAVHLLDRGMARWRPGMDAALLAQYDQSLLLINQSIAESRRALRQHPGDPAAAQFLLTAYAKKVELMREFALQ